MKAINLTIISVLVMALAFAPMVLAATNDSTQIVSAQNDTTSNITVTEVTNTTVTENATPTLTSAEPVAVIATPAQTDSDSNESVTDAQISWKTISLWFTFNQEKRAEKQLELAKLQLIRAKIAAKNNNTAAMEKAIAAHDALLVKVQGTLEKVKAKNLTAEKLKGLENAIAIHQERISKLESTLANANLTEEQRAKLEGRLIQAQNVTAHLKVVQDKVEQIKEKIQEVKQEIKDAKAEDAPLKEGEMRVIKKGQWNRPVAPAPSVETENESEKDSVNSTA